MPLARTSPSLRSRIVASQSPMVTIPSGRSGIGPPRVESYTERYRGTEYDSGCARPPAAGEPLLSDGRLMVIMSAALTVVAAAGVAVILG